MKILKNKQTGDIRREDNKTADVLAGFATSLWKFISKSEWKQSRSTNKPVEVVVSDKPTTKASKKNAEKKGRNKREGNS